MYAEGDFKITGKIVALVLLICLVIVTPACAGIFEILNIGAPVSPDTELAINQGTKVFVDESLDFKKTTEFQETQWKIWNFTKTSQGTEFWITNFNAPDFALNDVVLKNHDTGQTIAFNYSTKTTLLGNDTATIWNLFGILDPSDKLSKGETCQIRFTDPVSSLDIIKGDTIKTRWDV